MSTRHNAERVGGPPIDPRISDSPKRHTPCAWIDIDCPPQVQYLLPLKEQLERLGCDTFVTARDVWTTVELARMKGVEPVVVGAAVEQAKRKKVVGIAKRVRNLRRLFANGRRPDLAVGGSRAALISARLMRIPAFGLCDYEHVELAVARWTRSYVLFPEVIGPELFLEMGFRSDRLIPFPGLKEALSFAEIDLDAVRPHMFPDVDPELTRVLFRPPAEVAHYYVHHSRELAQRLLESLARRDDVVVILSPRSDSQRSYLDGPHWVNPPVLLERPVYFVSLLKAIDAVVSSGGTMLREAAFLGIPAYSILQSRIGAVDRHLESIGRLNLVSGPSDLGTLARRQRAKLDPIGEPGAEVAATLACKMLVKAGYAAGADGAPVQAA